MDIFNVLTLIGGLSLFLFGMNIMGQALERRAGGKLRALLGKFTTNRAAGLLTGFGITAVIQSSSATTVMVVGFVNSGLMTLKQAVNVIMGANIGTTVTAWFLSLAGIDSGNVFVKLLKPSSFTPVLAMAGIIFYMFCKSSRKKDTGMILLGFATLMYGMESMSGAVSGLRNVPAFQSLFVMFKNPIAGVLAGTVLTAIIQSSSASVGILQALAVTGQVSYGAAIPIIMGQNIGTCVTAMLSSVGANKNAKQAAMVHLLFNVIGTAVWLMVFCLIKVTLNLPFLDNSASLFGIAVAHSVFNILCTILILPLSGVLERLVKQLVPDAKQPEMQSELDERLLAAPPIALERCHKVAADMAQTAISALKESLDYLYHNTPELAVSIREKEEKTDYYEDILGTYLVKLSAKPISESDNIEAAKLLKMIGDFERISDHAVNILESAEEMQGKGLAFTASAVSELQNFTLAVNEILDLSLTAFLSDDLKAASMV
ncbi:MAG: Na/Pi cotransporter family protein, partial [Lachnospiraceae bacterium]|nr:Na/Pi cotransporter family protein [Lachnospiraceae bacterium]